MRLSIKRHAALMDTRVWLPWVPQLMTCLSLNAASDEVCRQLFGKFMQEYPNGAYSTLHADYFEKKERPATPRSTPRSGQPPTTPR